MKLAELERYFASIATSTSGPPADLADVFRDGAQLPACALLGIYNRGYHYRLLDALASVFPRTQRALGNAEFERLGLAYLARHPSEHPAVERVGRLFPDYLAGASALPRELTDLTRLEWARLSALVAPEPSTLTTAQGIDPVNFPSSRLHFVASLRVLSLDSRALVLFRGSAESGSPLAPVPVAPSPVAVWRKRQHVLHEPIAEVECEALELARTGASVSRFCAAFDRGSEVEDVAHAFRVVSAWFSREWIERCEPRAPLETE